MINSVGSLFSFNSSKDEYRVYKEDEPVGVAFHIVGMQDWMVDK